jgi:ABC-type uncharacterized transport system ATPase subunit
MIHKGQKVLDSTLPEIRARHDPRTVLVEPLEPGSEAAVRGVKWVREVTRRDGVLEALMGGREPSEAMQRIVEAAPGLERSSCDVRRWRTCSSRSRWATGESEADEEAACLAA